MSKIITQIEVSELLVAMGYQVEAIQAPVVASPAALASKATVTTPSIVLLKEITVSARLAVEGDEGAASGKVRKFVLRIGAARDSRANTFTGETHDVRYYNTRGKQLGGTTLPVKALKALMAGVAGVWLSTPKGAAQAVKQGAARKCHEIIS